jgi:hypothetical protein
MFEAIVGGAAVAGIGGLIGASGAKKAANAQVQAAEIANAETRRQFDLSRRDSAPYRIAGGESISRLTDLLGIDTVGTPGGKIPKGAIDATTWAAQNGFNLPEHRSWNDTELENLYRAGYGKYLEDFAAANPDAARSADFGSLNKRFTMEDFEADPVNKLGLQFGLDEGTKAVRRMFGAQGMGRSGAAAKALTRFGTDYAGSKAAESRNRFLQDQDVTFNRLAGISGVGQTATAQSASLGANMATNIGQNTMGAANARGAAAIAGANAFAAPVAAVGNTLSTKYLLDSFRAPSTAPSRPSFYELGDVYSGN